MTEAENKALLRRYVEECWGENPSPSSADELIAPEYVYHDAMNPPNHPRGPEGVKHMITTYYQAFPDFKVTLVEQIAEGNRVLNRWTAGGTHKGSFLGLPPTGTHATTAGMDIWRVEGGKIVEEYSFWDTLGFFQRLRILPPTDAIFPDWKRAG